MNSENKKNKTESPENDKLHRQKFVLAIIIFIAYLIFVVYLITQTKTKDDLIWTRLLYLFTGIEAIVFAALGYVFGKDINRKRAESAEKDAKKSKKEAENSRREAEKAKEKTYMEREKGIALSSAVKTKWQADVGKDKYTTRSGRPSDNNDDYLINLATRLYPLSTDYVTVSFEYEITPADNINDIIIDLRRKSSTSGYYSDVPIYDNRFSIDVNRKDALKDWTIKITNIIDSNGNTRKQLDGKLDSSYDSDYVRLENL